MNVPKFLTQTTLARCVASKQIFMWLGAKTEKKNMPKDQKKQIITWLQWYNKHIFYFTMYYCTGYFCWKKMYKADLKYPNFHSNYWQRGKKVPFKVKLFFCLFLQTSKISMNRHFYLVTMHASYSKNTTPESNSVESWCQFRGNKKTKRILNK